MSAWRETVKVLSSARLLARLVAADRTSAARQTVGDLTASQRDAASHLLQVATSSALETLKSPFTGSTHNQLATSPPTHADAGANISGPITTDRVASERTGEALSHVLNFGQLAHDRAAESVEESRRAEALSHVLNFGQLAVDRAADTLDAVEREVAAASTDVRRAGIEVGGQAVKSRRT